MVLLGTLPIAVVGGPQFSCCLFSHGLVVFMVHSWYQVHQTYSRMPATTVSQRACLHAAVIWHARHVSGEHSCC